MKKHSLASHPVYLDNNATTPLAREVSAAMSECLKRNYGNPSSSHTLGRSAKKVIEEAREQVSNLINSSEEEIIFTSGGTEANNMAILGTAQHFRSGHIISSSIEHPSVSNPLKHLEGKGFRVTYLPVNKHGIIDANELIKYITNKTFLITIMHSNNETGSIQPVAQVGRIAKEKGIIFHCDAAQSVGKVPVNAKRLNIDLLTIVSHKFYGPKGVGALYVKTGTKVEPIYFGASQENNLRAGTENVCSIVGLGKACEIAKKALKDRVSSMKKLSTMLHRELKDNIPGIKLNGHSSKRLPNTLNLSFPGVSGTALLKRLDHDIAASTGSACHEGKQSPSSVLKAMGVNDSTALSALRLSLGINTREKDIRRAARAMIREYRNLQDPLL